MILIIILHGTIFGKWKITVQQILLYIGFMCWILFPWIKYFNVFPILFPDVTTFSLEKLGIYSALIIDSSIAFIGIISVVVSIVLGSHYAEVYKKESNREKKLYEQVRSQGFVWICFIIYSIISILLYLILPILDAIN